jgi:uncharacterized protein YwgA
LLDERVSAVDPRDLVLAIVAGCPKGKVPGRTILQKLGYFCTTMLDLDVRYRPHFFGPYSDAVADATASLQALGFLQETFQTKGGSTRHDYALTAGGRSVLAALNKNRPDTSRVTALVSRIIKMPGWSDVQVISAAAKVDLILSRTGKAMTDHAVAREAGNLGWELTKDAVDEVFEFLESLGRVKVTRERSQ